MIHTLNTYAEVSPSGTGCQAAVHATLPPKCPHANHEDGFEVYDKQYFTITGNRVPGTPATINDRQQQVEFVIREFVAPKKHERNGHGNLSDVEPQDDIATARSALGGISASRAEGYWDWLTVGMACTAWGRPAYATGTRGRSIPPSGRTVRVNASGERSAGTAASASRR